MTALKKYLQLIIEKPMDWIRVKYDVVRKSMGIGYSLDYSEYNYNRWGQMSDYGFNDSLQRHAFYDSFVSTVSLFGFYVLHPWLPFSVSIIMLIIEKVRKGRKLKLQSFVFWIAVFYYLAYLLDTPAYDFRYFYPSLLLLLILEASSLLDWIGRFLRKGRKPA